MVDLTTNNNHIKSKNIKIFMEDMNKPKIIITYKVDTNKNDGDLLRENIKFWKEVGDRNGGRYTGKIPLVFIHKDLITEKDLTAIEFANRLLTLLHTPNSLIKSEKDLYKIIKLEHKNKKWRHYEEEVYRPFEEMVKIKRPHEDYLIYEYNIFYDVANSLVLEARQKGIKLQEINDKLYE